MAEPARPQLPPGARIAVGLVVLAAGVGIFALGLMQNPVGVPAGLTFVFAGALVLLPESLASLRLPLGALMITCLAAMFGWVAFGPGERHFTGSFGAGGAAVTWTGGEIAGRAFFGLFAALFGAGAIGLWIRVLRGARSQ
jgi:hypothetical protein